MSEIGTTTAADLSFCDWMNLVDDMLVFMVGCYSSDLPDVCYRDMFDDGMTPKAAARQALQEIGEF